MKPLILAFAVGTAVELGAQPLPQVSTGRIADTLIVGVWNAPGLRCAEYHPHKMLAERPEALRQEYVDEPDWAARVEIPLAFLLGAR